MQDQHLTKTTGPEEAPSIIFDKVSLNMGDRPLFDKLSMTIEGGLCTCILGPSGCGKSTLLHMISGATSLPYEGSIQIESKKAKNDKIAWMSQNDLLLPWLSLLENIILGAKLRNEESASLRARAGELMEEAGLAGYENALPATLSGGMRQRGALLRTLMEERPILLMDEPFSALDALARMKLQNLATKLTRRATVLLVTHDPMEALRMGDRILVLSKRPCRVQSLFSLTGIPPRNVDDPEIQAHLSTLLSQLMDQR
ncbi:ABC transporter ATP-binding protein [Desulfotalea psychrophila]|uniref:Probable ABC transporter, ATP-binding protein n=1 Tax=Desulfotalea psychrophila (strain LSv54 / DSM 12343) TaxID=177439 RepID=Q6AQZ5_DESPS|nr:ABC transporter ATP-binding protein [Desulfotalea psychrophila]CAG35229.1 probable ABC transporter, ATP-binding protein [Desulfotalea psychrophila LSv54]